MKTIILISGLLLGAVTFANAATNDLTTAIQRGLFEEEANQNLGAAIQAYQTVASQFDKDRKLAATAIFRLGECYRKQGNTNDAAVQYERILREFSDQPTLVTLSRQNLAGLGSAPPPTAAPVVSDAARQEQKRLLEEEIKLVQKQLESKQRQIQMGLAGPDDLLPMQREILELKRRVAALDAGQPVETTASDTTASTAATAEAEAVTLDAQLAELKAMPKDKLRVVVRQNFVNPVLTSLMQKRAETEQKLAGLQKEYGPEHTEVVKTVAVLETIDKQIDEQVQSVLLGLEVNRDTARKTAETLRAQSAMASLSAKNLASGSAPTAGTSSEADEVKRIEALIKDSPDLINAPDRKGETLLESAAAKGKLAVVKLLLDSGAAVDGLQQPGLTALHYAAANGHKAVVDLLLSKGAKPGAQSEGGITPLHLAARKGYEEVAKALLAAGAPVNAAPQELGSSDTEDLQYRISAGQTPLHLAASAGYAGLVELLLAKGAEVNVMDTFGRTPLSYAVDKHYEPVVQLLLAAHANPNAGSSDLPLTEAAYHGEMPALKLLLASGADPNLNTNLSGDFRTIYGWPGSGGNITPLAVAINQKHADAVAELIRAKANPNGSGPNGNSLVFWALGDIPTLKALLEGGANPNCLDREGYAPLYHAVAAGNAPAIELLLAHKADPNVGRPVSAWTPLHEAAQRGSKAIAELLIKAGADVNAKAQGGDTPLHIAVEYNQQEVAELLLANKADPNLRGNAGQTPLDVAKRLAQQNQPRLPGMRVPGSPGQPFSVSPAAREPEPKPENMAALLRRHGALDDLPHLDQIGVRRSTISFAETPFTKGAHDWSEFTLLELIAVQYQLLAVGPDQAGGSSYGASTLFGQSPWSFPDLAHLHISRPAADLKSWQDQVVDLTPVVASGDCAKDLRLRWGDVVEIPEADHPLNERWAGFSNAELANVVKCLTRKVEIVVKGQTTAITLAPKITGLEGGPDGASPVLSSTFPGQVRYEPSIHTLTPFWLRPVLLQSKLVLISSDLARVKVTRTDPSTGQKREWVVDCSKGGDAAPNLWLEDGDRIEVPERTYASAAQPEAPPAAAPAMPPPSFPIQPGLRPIPQPPARALRVPAVVAPQPGLPLQYQWQSQPLPQPPGAQPPPATPPPAPEEQAANPFAQRLANVVERLPAAQTAKAERGPYLDVGGVRYSPKANDPELLRAGYHKDRSARTRQAELWEQRAGSDLSGRACPAVWTGTDMVVFGGEGVGTSFDNGARYCLAEDTWTRLPSEGGPSSRTGHAMVWTGKEVIVWGGFGGVWGNNTNHNDGARYNPVTDTWKAVATKNAPAARFDFPAVWTGKEMLVWGGYTDSQSRYQGAHADAYLNTGGRYNPSSDSWKSITTTGAPSRRAFHSQLWTGKELIVWGGGNANKVLNDGARYDPARDAWKPISNDGAPGPRSGHVSVWTGKEMIVWGGSAREPSAPSDYFENGARYNPETDTWKPISTIGAPKGRVSATAVWTGTELMLWGGVNDAQAGDGGSGGRFVGTGARYNPATDTWTEITTAGAPSPRLTSGVWTGEGLLIFGGYNGAHLNDVWFYSPSRMLYAYVKPGE